MTHEHSHLLVSPPLITCISSNSIFKLDEKMRQFLVVVSVITCLASAFPTQASSFRSADKDQQAAMVDHSPGLVLPGSGDVPSNNDSPSDSVIIADVLGRDRSISIFASLARDVDSVADRFQNSGKNATVLAPTNAALTRLPRKPWEG